MNKSSKLKGMCMASVAVLLTTSCSKDAAYDDLFESDAIDLTVGVAGGGLTLPFGSTEKIYLTELIDPEDSDVIETDGTGKYFIRKDGTFDPTNFLVDPVHVKVQPTIDGEKIHLQAYDLPEEIDALLNLGEINGDAYDGKLLSELTMLPQITIKAMADNVDFEQGTTFDLKAEGVDPQLIQANHITPSNNVNITLTVEASQLPGKLASYDLTLDDIEIVLPSYIEIYDNANNKLDPTSIKTSLVAHKAAGATTAVGKLDYVIKAFDFAGNPLVNEAGKLLCASEISIKGKANIEEFEVDPSELRIFKEDGHFKVRVDEPVDFQPTISPIDVEIKTINGRFDPKIDDIVTNVDINLGDDVDFLQKDNVKIDAENPELTININYNSKVRVFADITLNSGKSQVTYPNVVIEDADGDGKQQIILTRKQQEIAGGVYYYANDALSTLLSPVPDQIDVTIKARADKDNDYDFTLGESIQVSGSYDVNVPFVFNSISFVYDEESKDIFGDDDDITKYLKNLDGVTIDAEVESTLPLDVILDIVSRDKNGNEKSVLAEKPVIKTGSTSLKLHPNIVLCETKDLIYRFSASGKGEFNANQYLQLKSSKLTIRDQKVDLNDL